jgi:chromosome segregation ATPase
MGKSDYEYLDEERKKLWHKVNTVETEVHKRIDHFDGELNKKATDYTDEARQASKKATEFRNKSEESKNTIFQYLEDTSTKLNEINSIFLDIETLSSNIIKYESESSANNALVKGIYDDIAGRKGVIENQIIEIEKIFEDHDSLVEKVEKLQDTLTQSNDTSAKIETLHRSLLGRKKEIDQLYYDIFGYTETEGGTETEVEGLKNKLEKSYDELTQDVLSAKQTVEDIKAQSQADYDNFQKVKQEESEQYTKNWDFKHLMLEAKIEALLPNALTAGLSSAYSEKKNVEIKEYGKLNRAFLLSIWGLVLVSLIPFAVGIISLFMISLSIRFFWICLD